MHNFIKILIVPIILIFLYGCSDNTINIYEKKYSGEGYEVSMEIPELREDTDFANKFNSEYITFADSTLNSFIAEAEKLKASNERAYRHMYLGEVTGTGGNVFLNLELRTITPEEIDTFGTFYNGLDFGFATDPDAFTRWHYNDKKRELYAVDEFYAQANSIDRLAEEVKKRCMRGVVRCDSADPRMISELKRRDVNAVGVKKGPGSVEHGTRWLQDLGKIVIDRRRTPNIAREFESYEYRMDRHENFIPDYPDKDNHTIDSARYAMEAVIAQRQLKTMSKSRLGF